MLDIFLQIGFLSGFFAPAILSVVYLFYSKKSGNGLSLRALAMIAISIAGVVAGVGMFLFKGENATGLLLSVPLTTENFEASIDLSFNKMLWIFGSSVLFINYLIFFGEGAFLGAKSTLRYLYFVGAFFSVAIAFMADQIFMSLLFLEISLFLLHAFLLVDGGEKDILERGAFLKRGISIFLGLIFVLCLGQIQSFTVDQIIVCGLCLYLLSLFLSRHRFLNWSNSVLSFFPIMLAFFIFSRVLKSGMATELLTPASIVFGVMTLIFSILSSLTLSRLNAFFWWSTALACNLFSFQFTSSTAPDSIAWAILTILTVLSAVLIGCLLEQIPMQTESIRKYISAFVGILLFAISIGAVPGICSALEEKSTAAYSLTFHFILLFALMIALGKMIFLQEGKTAKNIPSGARIYGVSFCAILLIAVQYSVLIAMTEAGELSKQWMDFNPDAYVAVFIGLGLVVLGALIAFFLVRNLKFIEYLGRRERSSSIFLPDLYMNLKKVNLALASYPTAFFDQSIVRLAGFSTRISDWAGVLEINFLQNIFWKEANAYLSAMSRYVRFFHRGSVRFYVFVAVLFFVVFGLYLVFV